jgi:MATE family multidrug resistance protein
MASGEGRANGGRDGVVASARRELPALLSLALPLIGARVGQMLMGLTDTLMAGALGADAVAAVGLATNVFFLVLVWAMGLLFGADPLVSQATGAGDDVRARAVLNAGRWMAVGLAAPVFLATQVAPDVLLATGQDAALVRDVSGYLFWVGAGAFPQLVAQVYALVLAARGITWPLLVVAVVSNLLNVALNAAFIYGVGPLPALGVDGIALSTCVGHIFELAMLVLVVHVLPGARSLRGPLDPPDRDTVAAIGRIGAPVAVQYAMEAGAFQVGSICVAYFGTAALAGHQVALTLVSVTFMASFGLSGAASVRVGNAIGRGDRDGARGAATAAWACGLGWSTLCAVAFLVFADPLVGTFVREPDARAAAAALLRIGAIFQIADATQAIGFGALRGIGDTRVPALFNVVGYWVIGLPIGLALAFRVAGHPGPIWWGWTLGLVFVAVATSTRFWARVGSAVSLESHEAGATHRA